MSLPFAAALRQLSSGLATTLKPATIRAACRAVGHTWRERRLDPVTTVHLFVLQILHGNTVCAHLPHLAGRTFSASAYCQARVRLPLAVLQARLRAVTTAAQPLVDTVGLWRGHRTWFVDGAGVSPTRPTSPARSVRRQPAARVRVPGGQSGRPVPHRHRTTPVPAARPAAVARDGSRDGTAPADAGR